MKRNQLLIAGGVVLIVIIGLIFFFSKSKKTTETTKKPTTPSLTTKLLVNELPLANRPFTLLVPHETNKLFTFVAIGADKAQAASLDLEYQSGDLLKGARASIDSPIANPYEKAIILGSCSTGGKCTFDKDLKSGTMKFMLTFPNQDATHVLKGNFVFLQGQNNLPDGKVVFTASKSSAKDNLIMLDSFGLPRSVDKETLLYPIVITSTGDKTISGTMTINQSGVTSAVIYDGKDFQPLKYTEKDGQLTIAINNKPWSMPAEIVRDDDKGNHESLTLYILGPIVLFK